MATMKKAKRAGTVNVRADKVNVSGSEVAQTYKHVPMEEKTSGWDEWELRDAMRTLTQAKKIRKNAALMRALQRSAQEQVKSLQSITKE